MSATLRRPLDGTGAVGSGGELDLDAIGRRAATLYERLHAVPENPEREAETHDSGQPWLQRWQQVFSPTDPAAFTRRLAWDGLDETAAASALADKSAGIPGEWTAWLPVFIATAADCAREFVADGRLSELSEQPETDEPAYAELWVPFVRVARAALHQVAGAAVDRHRPGAIAGLERALAAELALVAELAVHERRAEDEPYAVFVSRMLNGGLAALCAELPVLARQIARLVETWIDAGAEMLTRLSADAAQLAAAFGPGAGGRLVEVRAGLSDRHHGGRRVAILRFESGLQVVYKPRDIALERAFHGFLAWLLREGLATVPRPLSMVQRDGYGWAEYVEPVAGASDAEAAGYFRRAGALAAAAHILRARDLHNENVVAAPGGPILVDVEALMQPVDRQEADGAEEGGRGARRAARSCLATSLISLVQNDAAGRPHDTGGLRASTPRAAALARRVWREPRTDRLRLELDPTARPVTANVLAGAEGVWAPERFADEILAGFAEAYRFVAARRERVLAADGPLAGFSGTHTRILFRPSDQYAGILYVLAAPRYQADGRVRSLGIESLARVFAREAARPILWPLVEDERAALEELDVPRFTIAVGETDLVSSRGARARGYFIASGMDAVRTRVQALDEGDLQEQLELLRSALAPAPVPEDVGGAAPATRDVLIAAAERIARVIEERPWRAGGRDPGDGLSLYDGTAGKALLLAALAAVTNKEEWQVAARHEIAALADAAARILGPAAWRTVGAGNGLGGVLYVLSTAGRLLGEAEWRTRARELADVMPASRIASEVQLDVESGVAGALLGALALPGGHATPLARACVDRLLAAAVATGPDRAAWPGPDGRTLAGFAHGAAGIAYALARHHAHEGAPAVAEAVHRAWRHERAAYSASERNWPLSRPGGGTLTLTAWCHGAPGIALARAFTPESLRDAGFGEEIRTAIDTTARAAPLRFDHLCCGNLGRSDILLTVGRRLRGPGLVAAAEAAALAVAHRVCREGAAGVRTAGFQWRVALPGFFDGLAGVGYALLRAAAPAVLPSVLGFESEEGGPS